METVMLCGGVAAQKRSGEAVRTFDAWSGMVD